MTGTRRGFIRDNLVLIAAFVLPAAVALLFLAATAIPRWTVPPPQHDLVLRAQRPYESPAAEVTVEFTARDGRVEAIVRPVPKQDDKPPYVQSQPPRWGLLLFDHAAMEIREIRVDIPATLPPGETQTIPVAALAGRRVLTEGAAPDGYEVDTTYRGSGTGIVGDLFGMSSSRSARRLLLSRDGRNIELTLPTPYRTSYWEVQPLGWIEDGRSR